MKQRGCHVENVRPAHPVIHSCMSILASFVKICKIFNKVTFMMICRDAGCPSQLKEKTLTVTLNTVLYLYCVHYSNDQDNLCIHLRTTADRKLEHSQHTELTELQGIKKERQRLDDARTAHQRL